LGNNRYRVVWHYTATDELRTFTLTYRLTGVTVAYDDVWQPLHVEPRFLLGTSVVEKLKAQKITVPVLVLTGDADAAHRRKILDLVPAARQAIIKNAGHVSNLENPDDFNQKLFSFLSSIQNK
jgi:pimeloyl-ACP methyl ester carboxylesterase